MYCPKCGKENKDGSMFCYACGARLTQEQEKTVQPGRMTENMHIRPVKTKAVSVGLTQTKGNETISLLLVFIGAVLLVISAFVPAVKVSFLGYSQSFNLFTMRRLATEYGTSGNADEFLIFTVFGIAIIVLSILLAWMKERHKRMAGIIISMVALAFSIYLYANFNQALNNSMGFMKIGSGTAFSILGSIIALVGSILTI